MNLKSDDYLGRPVNTRQGRTFEPWDVRGYDVIQVLPFLWGCLWDDVALAYVHALRPSHLRILRGGGAQMDAQTWRVTVWLDENGRIQSIEQEVEVGLPDGVECGDELSRLVTTGIDE